MISCENIISLHNLLLGHIISNDGLVKSSLSLVIVKGRSKFALVVAGWLHRP